MRHRRTVSAALVGVAVLAVSYAYAQKLDLRTGEWSFTMTGLGGLTAAASQLPPEVRAQLEAVAKQPMTYPTCLTTADLEQLNLGPPDEDDEMCEITSRKLTGKTLEMTRECKGDDKHTETIRVEALSTESLKATVTGKTPMGPLNLTITGKWVGATCTDE